MKNKKPFSIPVYIQTLLAMLVGAFTGLYFGEQAAFLGQYSKLLIELIKTIAMPLLFCAILDAILSAEIRGKGVLAMLLICTINGILAISIALLISNFLNPGSYLPLKANLQTEHVSQNQITHGLMQAFSTDPKISIFSGTTAAIILSISLGLLLLSLKVITKKHTEKPLQIFHSFIKRILNLLFTLIEWVALIIPLAVFCAVAKVVGLHGFLMVKGLSAYFLTCILGMLLHVLLVYQGWIKFIAKIPLRRFWKEAKEPLVYAFGVNSSLATLPATLKSLKNLKVSDGAARLGACIGTNLNNDGILLYEVFASLFLTQAYGMHLPVHEQLLLAILCIIATIGVAGVPEAGMISLTLVISAIGLPTESLPILLTVDWFLGRVRSQVNVLGDMTVSLGIDSLIHERKT